jgi:hypothetical protein
MVKINTTQGPKDHSQQKKKENPEEKNGKGLLYINNNKTNEASRRGNQQIRHI